MKILIGTPSEQGRVTARYFMSVRNLEAYVRQHRPDVTFDVMMMVDSFLPKSRNIMASRVLNDPSISHLFFVDDDMGFKPSAFLKLLDFADAFVGHICPSRHIDLGSHYRVARDIADDAKVRSAGHEFVSTNKLVFQKMADGTRRYIRRGNFIKTLALGAGVTLLSRRIFEDMAKRLPELVIDQGSDYHSMGFKGRYLQCFSPLTIDGHAFSEDLSFCHRWVQQCGGEIWACVDEPISHVGIVEFTGTFLDKMRYEQARGGAAFDPAD